MKSVAVGAGWFEAPRHRLMEAEPLRSSYANNVRPSACFEVAQDVLRAPGVIGGRGLGE
jgi:hypothetical protein